MGRSCTASRGNEARTHGLPDLLPGPSSWTRLGIGGKPTNRHGHNPARRHAYRQTDKTPIVSLISTRDGRGSFTRDPERPRERPWEAIAPAVEYQHQARPPTHRLRAADLPSVAPSPSPALSCQPHAESTCARRHAPPTPQTLLLATQALARRHTPPRQPRAPAPLPRGVRLPVHDLQRLRHRANRPARQPRRRPAADVPLDGKRGCGIAPERP